MAEQYDDLAVSFEALARGTIYDRDDKDRLIRDLSWCWRSECTGIHFSTLIITLSLSLRIFPTTWHLQTTSWNKYHI